MPKTKLDIFSHGCSNEILSLTLVTAELSQVIYTTFRISLRVCGKGSLSLRMKKFKVFTDITIKEETRHAFVMRFGAWHDGIQKFR